MRAPLVSEGTQSYRYGVQALDTAYYSTCRGGDGGALFTPSSDDGVDAGESDAGDAGDTDASDTDASDTDAGDTDAADASDASDGDSASCVVRTGNPCCAFDDLSVATRGIHRGDFWITRLRANLPVAALASDLRLEATSSQSVVDNVHFARALPQQLSPSGEGCTTAPAHDRYGRWITLGGALLGVAAILRRRR